MKIAVFEWLCGGGMHGFSPEQVSTSLMQEGWAMLQTVASQLAAADHRVTTIIDDRYIGPDRQNSLPDKGAIRFEEFAENGNALSTFESTVQAWVACAKRTQAELSLIIAPEIDGILQRVIEAFQSHHLPILNCTGDFLNRTCDKWLTASGLEKSGLPHPRTQLLSQLSSDWNDSSSSVWCMKSRLGAGCDDMWVGDRDDCLIKQGQVEDARNWIVQPWIEGSAFSCSAIVDRHGSAAWLPLVTQQFRKVPVEVASSGGSAYQLSYQGGRIVDRQVGPVRPDHLLDNLLTALGKTPGEALGWIGVDLLLQPDGRWVIIEVNPRLTTSVLGLSRAAPCNLGRRLVDAYVGTNGRADEDQWRSVEFTAVDCL